jgi:predicted ATPase/class 3 adenylate cyclase
MHCSACGTDNEAGRKFCGECGTALTAVCAACGSANTPGAKFCGDCGAQLGAEAAAPPSPSSAEPVAERKLVSVLFADLVGFTAASEARDAEDTRELLSRYFDTCRRLIELYGGTVEKFIGDAVMAVWGTPTATEDDAERAVRAALDLVAAVTALGDEGGVSELRARAAVMTGEAAVTIGAEGQGMVAGDLVNTASRVQSLADPGSVLVGEVTRRATDQTVAYEDAGSHELKGKVGLTPLWRALRIVSGARGSLKSAGLEAPFVGRDRELRQVKELFHACADEGRAHLVSITGIAGIGKSRLGWEFYKYFDGIAQITYWHRGRCLSYGEGVTYWALADMVRMRARIAEDEDEASALAKLAAVVEEHLADPAECRFVEPRLAHLLGLEDESGRYEREDLFAAWRLFFERLAAVYPVVMLFEDMQWADASLLDFIEHLLEWGRNSPILVVTQARPELLEQRPTWGAGHRNFSSIYLEPLPERAMEELLTGLVPGLPEELRAKILARAEGIPLYAVETVRMLLDRGALVQEGAVYRPAGTIESLEVPETLHALIAARLDGLPQAERRVVQDASVLGKTFTKQSVAALTELPEADLEPLLASLTRKEIFGVQADPRSPEHGQYGFLQDLLRKVAYETLAKADRKARHLAAAAYLERTLGEQEVVEVVASHYLDAYRVAPDAADAGEIRATAGERLAGAGVRAASLGANEEAERYFAQAAELADDPVAKATLEEQAGRIAWRGLRPVEARVYLGRALAAFEAAGLGRRSARVSATVAEIDYREGHLSEAVARLETALGTLADEEPDEDLAYAAAQLGRFLVLNNQSEEGAPRLELALELAEALRLPEVFCQALTSKAISYVNQNRLEEGRILLEGALERALANDLHTAATRTVNNLAVDHESADRYREAVNVIAQGLELARRVGDRLSEEDFVYGPLSSLVLLGEWDEVLVRAAGADETGLSFRGLLLPVVLVECARGDLDKARDRLDTDVALRESEDLQEQLGYGFAEAHVLRLEGRPRDALAAADSALALGLELGTTFINVKLCLVEVLEAAFAVGDRAEVERRLEMIEGLRPGERPLLLEAQAHRFRSKLNGDEAGFRAAAALFRELETPFWLAVTLLEHGEATGSAPLVDEAREIFARLEAAPWLARCNALAPARAETASV